MRCDLPIKAERENDDCRSFVVSLLESDRGGLPWKRQNSSA